MSKVKIIPLVCPKCGGAINVVENDTHMYKCPYCDTPIYFDNGVKRSEKTVNINKNIKKENINRNYNYNENYDKTEGVKAKSDIILVSILLVFFLVCMLFLLMMA